MRTRAITSTLTARLSPTVPSASQTYEPLVKSALRQRLIHNIFAFSVAFTLVVSILLGGEDETSTFARLFSPGTWTVACLKWSFGVLPVIAMRKVYLTCELLHLVWMLSYICCIAAATPATSPAKMITNAIAKPSTRRCLAVYMSCTLMLITLFMSSFTSEERENLRLNVFVKSRYVIQQLCPEDSCMMCNLIPSIVESWKLRFLPGNIRTTSMVDCSSSSWPSCG